MDSIPQIFNFENKAVRLIMIEGEPWFVAKDVALLLGYSNPLKAIRSHCKGVNEMGTPSPGGIQNVKIIPERDVYRLIMRSKFHQTSAFICGFPGLTEKKLIANRNKLKQEGLIVFQAGRKGRSSSYTFKRSLFHWKNSSTNDRVYDREKDRENDSKYAVESAAYMRQEKDKTKDLSSHSK